MDNQGNVWTGLLWGALIGILLWAAIFWVFDFLFQN